MFSPMNLFFKNLVWSLSISRDKNFCIRLAMHLEAILKSRLRRVIGRQFFKSFAALFFFVSEGGRSYAHILKHSKGRGEFPSRTVYKTRLVVHQYPGFYSIALILDFPSIRFPLNALRIPVVPIHWVWGYYPLGRIGQHKDHSLVRQLKYRVFGKKILPPLRFRHFF